MLRLETDRLLLRPPELRDVPDFVRWVGDFDVAKNLVSAPHPYAEQHARAFIAKVADGAAKGEIWCFAIVRKDDWRLIGCTGIHLRDGMHELGYWVGKPFWNRGYTTEAARRIASFAFRELKAANLCAGWFYDNPASARVLEKLGFQAGGSENRPCAARGHEVVCNMATLTAGDFRRMKAPQMGVGAEAR